MRKSHNFVCFGSDAETCETDNLYRIIGIFNDGEDYQVKLIKYDYATSSLLGTDGDYNSTETVSSLYYLGKNTNYYYYYWNNTNKDSSYSNSGYYNDWSYSELNKTNLNTNFLNNIGSTWSNLIATHTWIVGGNTEDNIYGVSANNVYANEITAPETTQVESTYEAKVGLMYVSDYAYAADPTYWSTTTYNYQDGAYKYDWMYMGDYEWTITRSSYYTYGAFAVMSSYVFSGRFTSVYGYNYVVRPCFYLDSSVQISSGSGTASDPYRLQT